MEKARIMIVDDTPVNLEILHQLLSSNGYQTAVFPSGARALLALEKSAPDLILLDVNMPDMNGYELCGRIKKQEKLKDIPVIFLSAMHEVNDKLNAFHTGGVDYITKPFQIEEVLVRVKTHLKIRHQQLQLEENFAALQELQQSLEKSKQSLEESLDTLKKDQEAGRTVQLKLLPKSGATLGSYEFTHFLKPSMYMSGDFLDYFELDEKYAVFYFADVSGHGAASAFITFLMKSFIGSYRTNYLKKVDGVIIDPAELLERFNRCLMEENLDKFVAIFFGVLDKSANKLIFANGGHFPMPFLCSPESSRQVIQKSVPVGLFDTTVYSNAVIELPEEFSFMLFSDGVLEILTEDNVLKQLEILKELTRAVNGDINHVIHNLKLDTLDTPLDDVTIMLITRRRQK